MRKEQKENFRKLHDELYNQFEYDDLIKTFPFPNKDFIAKQKIINESFMSEMVYNPLAKLKDSNAHVKIDDFWLE